MSAPASISNFIFSIQSFGIDSNITVSFKAPDNVFGSAPYCKAFSRKKVLVKITNS